MLRCTQRLWRFAPLKQHAPSQSSAPAVPAGHASRWFSAKIVPRRLDHGCLRSRPPELRTVGPDTVQNDGELPRDCVLTFFGPTRLLNRWPHALSGDHRLTRV